MRPIYDASITYVTPANKRIRYSAHVAASTLDECEKSLKHKLYNEHVYGRRKVKEILDDFTATFVTNQISTY